MDLIESLHFPSASILNKRVFKKTMLENAELSNGERKTVRDEIEVIIWEASLKPANCNIPAYITPSMCYDEIHWITANLRKTDAGQRVASILQKAIPYPLVLVLRHETQLAIQIADKRVNQNDQARRTIEREQITPWFQQDDTLGQEFLKNLDFIGLSKDNLERHYQNVASRVTAFLSAQYTGKFSMGSEPELQPTLEELDKIAEMEAEITRIRKTLKSESQFNRKVEMNVQLKQLEMKCQSLIKALKR
jgi:hypothetical protein